MKNKFRKNSVNMIKDDNDWYINYEDTIRYLMDSILNYDEGVRVLNIDDKIKNSEVFKAMTSCSKNIYRIIITKLEENKYNNYESKIE